MNFFSLFFSRFFFSFFCFFFVFSFFKPSAHVSGNTCYTENDWSYWPGQKKTAETKKNNQEFHPDPFPPSLSPRRSSPFLSLRLSHFININFLKPAPSSLSTYCHITKKKCQLNTLLTLLDRLDLPFCFSLSDSLHHFSPSLACLLSTQQHVRGKSVSFSFFFPPLF